MNTLDEIKNLIHTTFGIDTETLKPDQPLSAYGLDSLALVELLFTIEEHFNLDIPDSRGDITNLTGLAKLIDELRSPQVA